MLVLSRDDYYKILSFLGIKIKRQGQFMTTCPFHVDKSPSLSISIEKGIYKCFSCRKSGTIANLVYLLTGHGINKILGEGYKGIEVYYDEKEDYLEKLQKGVTLSGTIEGLPKWVYDHLINDRQLTPKCISTFDIGYTDDLVVNGTNLSKRIIIPIYFDGKLVNIEARKTPKGRDPKVLYPKDTIKPLFNFDNLEKFDFEHYEKEVKPLWITEGLMDCLKLYSWFDTNVTCIFGNQISEFQRDIISENFKKVIIMPDNDDSGKVLVKQLQEIHGLQVNVCPLPNVYKDAGEAPLTVIGKSIKSNLMTIGDYYFKID